MRNILILGAITLLGACDGAPTVGDLTEAVSSLPCDCRSVARLARGHVITVESLGADDRVLVRSDGQPLCLDSLAGAAASGVLGGDTTASGPGKPSSSDPMPARGDGDDKSGTSGGGGGGGGNNGGGNNGGGNNGGGTKGGTGTTSGGEGNSDPMPADDTRRN